MSYLRTRSTKSTCPLWSLPRGSMCLRRRPYVLVMQSAHHWDRSDGILADDLDLNDSPLALPLAEARLFSALFPKLWPVSWPDMDVWARILGEDHPQYYFSSEVELPDEVKARIKILRFPWLDY